MKKCESKLNPFAEEFVPSTRRRLLATAPEFFPSGHIRRSIASDVAQAQRSRAQPGSSHAVSLNQPHCIHYSSNRRNCTQFSLSIYVLMIYYRFLIEIREVRALVELERTKMRRKNRKSREQFTSEISILA